MLLGEINIVQGKACRIKKQDLQKMNQSKKILETRQVQISQKPHNPHSISRSKRFPDTWFLSKTQGTPSYRQVGPVPSQKPQVFRPQIQSWKEANRNGTSKNSIYSASIHRHWRPSADVRCGERGVPSVPVGSSKERTRIAVLGPER